MASSRKAANGSGGSQQGSRSGSLAPAPPTSDPVVPSSDSLALPGPSVPASKKLFPLFDSKARKNGKAISQAGISDVESTAGLSESSQSTTKKKKKKATTASTTSKGTSKSNGTSNSQTSDASNATKEKAAKPAQAIKGKSSKTAKAASKSKSQSPRIDLDLDDPNTTISTVASTSRTSTTPPLEPHKTVITIMDSPIREMKPGKTFADFEAERIAKKAAKEAGGWNGGRLPLWPARENMHVQPYGETFETQEKTTWPKKDWKGKGRATEADLLVDQSDAVGQFANIRHEDIASILQLYTRFHEPSPRDASQSAEGALDQSIRERLKLVSQNDSPDRLQQSLYTRYAPSRVADILGESNRENAAYLRDWLRELTLQDPMKVLSNSRKRKVKREVTSDERKRMRKAAKRRKRKGYDGSMFDDDDLQDFIASNDDEEYEHYDYYDLPDDASVPSPTKSTSSHGSRQRGRFEPLTNVILLAGPVASGKTSTVYAIADELHWQVFEVYPGIGKRGYKDLERYVGMVGENHIMKRDVPPVSSFFGKAASSTAKASKETSITNGTSESKPSQRVDTANSSSLTATVDENTVKQSCILIEEVDNLYESDSGFWEGLISLISKSRRPVILTCNDINAVPRDSLPLQNVLHLHSLDEGTVKTLLREISHLEGKVIDEGLIERVVKQCSDGDGMSDVRQAINQLQFTSASDGTTTSSVVHEAPTPNQQDDLRLVQNALEIASFADAEIRRRSWMAWEDNERIAQPEKEDDEFLYHPSLPVHKLDPPPEPEPTQPLPILAREAEFCEALVVPEDVHEELNILYAEQWKLCASLQEVAEEYLDDSIISPKDAKMHLDYLPMLREIVRGDDMQEIAYNIALEIQADDVVLDARVRRSRRIAGSGKESYRRHLDISKEGADILRRSGFSLDGDEQVNQIADPLPVGGEMPYSHMPEHSQGSSSNL